MASPRHAGLFLLDAVGPFFRHARERRINWSKIPFRAIESGGRIPPGRANPIVSDFERVADAAARLNFTGLTLDDVAHLVDDPDYPDDLRRRIADYRELYARLFRCAAARGLKVYLTTDVMFFNETIRRKTGARLGGIIDHLASALTSLFRDYPELGGVITRIGETDGLDVEGDFKSELTLRTLRHARQLLRGLLPIFEFHERTWIFRTWSLGAYRIGDLMWNRATFRRTFNGIDSPNLVISLKPGESDFFRFLPLNKQFFRSRHKKIVEIQARREYEGFGEFPSFIGWDCESIARMLDGRDDVVGASVWCQTGGWSGFRRLTFLDSTAIWAEINVATAMGVIRDGLSTERAVARFARDRLPLAKPDTLLKFLRLSDEVIRELLYLDEFSRRKLFFRRLRVPPLLWVFWDNIVINHSMRKLLRCFVSDGEAAIRQGRAALDKLREMIDLAPGLGLPEKDLRFQYDTFEILAVAREYYFRPYTEAIRAHLLDLARRYRRRHRPRFHLVMSFAPLRLTRHRMRQVLRLFVRDKRGYRIFDRIVTIRFLSWLYPILRRASHDRMPEFAERQAMGIHTLFR